MNNGGVASGLRGSCRRVPKLDARAEEPGEDEEHEEGADGEGHGRGHHVHAHAAAPSLPRTLPLLLCLFHPGLLGS